MNARNPLVLVGALLLLALAVSLSLWLREATPVSLPGPVTTIAAGYPFAVTVKNRTDRSARLTTVMTDLDRRGGQFDAPKLVYGFAAPEANGRVFTVTVDNAEREAFVSMDAPVSPDTPYMPPRTLPALDLAKVAVDLRTLLTIARTNGLDEFCALTTPQQGQVHLNLHNNSSNGPVWGIVGDGWDERGPIADLAITIDARSGAVLSHTLTKALNRP